MAVAERDADRLDAVCVGETMVSFVATEDPATYTVIPAGAESNVAVGMARLGCRTRWVSRIGDDPLGRIVEESIAGAGVDVSVVRDPHRPTGVMVKHPSGDRKVSSYHRSESAAWGLGPDDLSRVGSPRWTHVTGITPALSPSARELVQLIVEPDDERAGLVSFDVNYRSKLWPDADTAAEIILPLAQNADVVFIGDDEARELYGIADARALADLLLTSDDQTLVVKRGAENASAITAEGEVSAHALATEAVDVTGAGDAFAAGYLAASCFGWPTLDRIRLGHVMASRVVGSLDDSPAPLTDEEVAGLSRDGLASLWEVSAPDGRPWSDGHSIGGAS